MTGLVSKLARFWYAPGPAERLGVIRAAVGIYAVWYLWSRRNMLARIGRSDDGLYDPVGIFRILDDPMDPVAFDWMVWLTIIVGILFVLGLAYRYVGALFPLLLLGTLCYRNSWTMIYHSHNVLVVHALVLGFTRSADAFSVDALLRSRQGVLPPEPAATYGWPIKLLCAVTAAGYFLSGFAKLAGPQGLGWAHGVAMREQVAVDALRKELLEGGAPRLAYTLYDQVWLFTLMGIGTYVLELGAPLFLFGRRSRRLWAVCAWVMHWGIFMIMGIKFRYQLAFIVFLPFFNVEWIAHGARMLLPAGARRTRTP